MRPEWLIFGHLVRMPRPWVLLVLLLAGCSSNYTLERGGWRLDTDPRHPDGACLQVYGDGDDDVLRVCIKEPGALKIDGDVLEPLCKELPACTGCD